MVQKAVLLLFQAQLSLCLSFLPQKSRTYELGQEAFYNKTLEDIE